MGYMHIDNLYKNKDILFFKTCYALDKVHGTSAHIKYDGDGQLSFFSGGAKHKQFVDIFDQNDLMERFASRQQKEIIVYGEAYGGKLQGMKHLYGPDLRFIVFDVKIGDVFVDVPTMDSIATSLGLDVVPWSMTTTDLDALDALRDAPSRLGIRLGMGEHIGEGIVLRPPIEVRKNNGDRIIAKHKSAAFVERARQPRAQDVDLVVLEQARAIADEWVTEMRLTHVMDRVCGSAEPSIEHIPQIINAMLEDVLREGSGEIVDSLDARKEIKRVTSKMFKKRIMTIER